MRYPRNNQYELFIYVGLIQCFDDSDFTPIKETSEIHNWIQNQPKDLWRTMKPKYNVYYLQPKLYTWFKLRWCQ